MIDMDLIVASAVIAEGHAEELERQRRVREDPCRYCGGGGISAGPDSFGNYDPCDECDGTGVDGGF